MSESLDRKLTTARACFDARDLAGAERACREILRQEPDHGGALHVMGMIRMASGRPKEAVSLLSRAAGGNLNVPVVLEHLGIAHLAAAEYGEAESALRRAMAAGAMHGQVYMRLGLALSLQGKREDAAKMLTRAVDLAPTDTDAHLNLGNLLAESGKTEDALACYQKALALQPDHVAARYNLGNLQRILGRLDEAAEHFKAVLASAPDDADTHNNLGMVYERQQRYEDAAASFRRALEIHPGLIAAHNNLGNVLKAQGQPQAAADCYQEAMRREPSHPDAYINLGNVRTEAGASDEAKALYERALQLDPASYEAHYNLARLSAIAGEPEKAVHHHRKAVELAPDRAFLHNDLGNAYRVTGDWAAAAACYRSAIEKAPGDAEAHFNLGEVRKLEGRLDEAIAHYGAALERDSKHVAALSSLVHVRQHVCSWEGIEAQWQALIDTIATGGGGRISPFSTLSMPTSPAEQLASATAWAQRELATAVEGRRTLAFDFSVPRERNRLRIGYLSWGFHRHATAYLTAELFELHDRDRFEIFAYAYGPDDGSAIRARIRGACEHFTDISGESHVGAAKRIYHDGVDILVDLTGYTLGARPQILALRPAPVQVGWLGYPGTLGTECVDYLVTDAFIVPPTFDQFYAEKVVRLPHCYQVTDRRREIADRVPGRAEYGLPAEGVVFCCFNQAYKILPDTFASWLRILQAVPGSTLWLAEANQWMVENLRRAAVAAGVSADRLVFAPRKPMPEYLVQYRCADIALDTFPYTSHTTASDALWMGCPLVTRTGETFASRVAGSILTNAGLPELIAGTPAEYERIVVALARSSSAIEGIRRKLETARASSPLFDSALFVRHLEDAYAALFRAFRDDSKDRGSCAPQTG